MAVVEGQKASYFVPANMNNWTISSGIKAKKNNRIGERVVVDYNGTDWLGFIEGVEADKNIKVM